MARIQSNQPKIIDLVLTPWARRAFKKPCHICKEIVADDLFITKQGGERTRFPVHLECGAVRFLQRRPEEIRKEHEILRSKLPKLQKIHAQRIRSGRKRAILQRRALRLLGDRLRAGAPPLAATGDFARGLPESSVSIGEYEENLPLAFVKEPPGSIKLDSPI